MPSIQEITQNLKAKIATRRGTPEEIERAYRNAMQRNLECRLGCPVCGGLGFVKDEHDKMHPCPNRSAWALFRGERYGLSEAERSLTWKKVVNANRVKPAVTTVRRALERGAGWVYLWGPPGLAKTLILKTAVAVSQEGHIEAAYTRMAEVLDDMRAAYDTHSPSAESQRRLDWWAGLPILAIDEFDRVRDTEYAAERQFLLMDRRYEKALRGASVTLLAGNTDPALLDGYLYDRIRDGRFRVVQMNGSSLRPLMEW